MRLYALFLGVFCLPFAIWPYRMARLEERLDAIGSKRSWSEVEPADWKVAANRYVCGFFSVAGWLYVLLT